MDLCEELTRLAEDYRRHCATVKMAPASSFDWLRYWPAMRTILDILMNKCTPLMTPSPPEQPK